MGTLGGHGLSNANGNAKGKEQLVKDKECAKILKIEEGNRYKCRSIRVGFLVPEVAITYKK